MQKIEPLTEGRLYHLYNRGINGCNLFKGIDNYNYFLKLYTKYIDPVAETYVWVLMPNHFHFLVWVKDVNPADAGGINTPDKVRCSAIVSNQADAGEPIDRAGNSVRGGEGNTAGSANLLAAGDENSSMSFNVSKQLSNLFNAYAQAFNKRNARHGALFERPFKRKLIDEELYLINLIQYIHNNPVHHGFCEQASDYPWSSYRSCISAKPTKIQREKVNALFDDLPNFIFCHNRKLKMEEIDRWLSAP